MEKIAGAITAFVILAVIIVWSNGWSEMTWLQIAIIGLGRALRK